MVFLILALLSRGGMTRRNHAKILSAPGVDHDDYPAQSIPSKGDPAFFLV